MRISYHLKLEQTQKLIMTPELQQAINLLQLSSLELHDFLQEELLNNPVLDVEEPEEAEKKSDDSDDAVNEKDAIDWEQYFRDQDLDAPTFVNLRRDEDGPAYDHYLSREPSLQEYLLLQLGLCKLDETQKRIGEFLIGNIDPNGYLTGDTEEFALLLGVDTGEIEAVLSIIQKFDPAGVAARNLQECLLLQVAECKAVHPLAEIIIKEHLADVAENRFKKIAADLGVEPGAVQAAVDFIRTLDPKPGRLMGDSSDTRYIIPDVAVEKVSGDYVVLVNEINTPRLTINSYYRSILGRENGESLTSSFIKNKLDSALWLLRSIEQRRQTLYRVTECIVRMQRCFFDEGIKHLRAMTLKQVAEEVGVHESTVSRATANKYVQTPRGLYPLKFFFASGVDDQKGASISSEAIKSHLRELIESENPYRPLSDQKLTDLLEQRDILVSRRTVAKYREELSIPSSNKRKRH
jgi:RNA polymerase sigma-54 factor